MIEPPSLAGHVVRRVQPLAARKPYVCPECGRDIPPGEGHVVVWPEHDPDARRHWHHGCWRQAARRGRIA